MRIRVIVIIVLLANRHAFPCCSSKSVEVKTTEVKYSPAVSHIAPTEIEKYRAHVALQEYKKAHPTAVAQAQKEVGSSQEAVDNFLIARHLRSQSRHLDYARAAWVNQNA